MANIDLQTARHSLSHILAAAVQTLYPGTRLGIGPAIDNGFYYDFQSEHKFAPEDLKAISDKMKEIIKSKQPFECKTLSKEEAKKLFTERGEHFKIELIDALEGDTVSIYTNGDFVDLCKGPHVEHTGQINNFKLTHIAGAYWKGDETRPMLQRIYGLAFETKDALNAYIKQQEEAAKRDHRKLGTELDLFSINEDIGPGLILMHPKGGMLRKVVEDWIKDENIKHGYDMVYSPHIARLHLWEKSGHASFYGENMFKPIEVDEQQYQLKPMNCPFHIAIYNSHLRSYRDLPVRLAELGTVYRYERSGVVHGLLRVRGFTQDDAHIFCTPEQMNGEIEDCFNFAMLVMKTFGFEKFSVELSTWDETKPENYTGKAEDWHAAQGALEAVLKKNNVPFTTHAGEAAFYGPKIDIKVMDAIGRFWQLSTIQFDFNLPEKFNLEYVSNDGRKRPLMVHRALLGSIERFLGVLIEHYAGLFPLWLSPVQVCVATLTDDQLDYAKELTAKMKLAGLRVHLDARPEKLGLKIREAHLQKTPYTVVIGAKEQENNVLTLRLRSGKNVEGVTPEDFINTLKKEVETKSLENLYK
ncbi:threonyl-tRNA synthetase [Elusimicrobium simillimum]|uniref:threonine--tRNA ligase n=1 Tax=Elusimicrobium simillimum TaxID=3143438 RepID=UPI003C701239